MAYWLFAAGPDFKMKYAFAHFPVDQSCNPYSESPSSRGLPLCLVAEGADLMAAGGLWKLHNWIMVFTRCVHRPGVGRGGGFERPGPGLLEGGDGETPARAKVAADAQAGKQLGIQSIPMVFINGKFVPRWKLENENLLRG